MSMSQTPLLELQKFSSDAFWMRIKLMTFYLGLFVCSSIALTGIGMEIIFLKSFFDHQLGVAISENHVAISNALKSLISVFAILALHLALARGSSESPTFAKTIVYMACIMIVALGLAFSYSVSSTGLLDVGNSSERMPAGTLVVNLPPWFTQFYKNHVLLIYPTLVSLAMPLVAILTAYVTHRMIKVIKYLFIEIIKHRSVAVTLKTESEQVFNAAIEREHSFSKSDQCRQKLAQDNVAELIHVVALDTYSTLKNAVDEREKKPLDVDFLKLSQTYKGVPNSYFHDDLEKLRKALDVLFGEIEVNRIEKALKGELV